MLHLKRVYEKPSVDDGLRILVDRLWPRGLSKTKAKIDVWLKEIAPTNDLRKWYGHDPKKWAAFRQRYLKELRGNTQALTELRKLIKSHEQVTFLFAAKDTERNNAVVLQGLVKKR